MDMHLRNHLHCTATLTPCPERWMRPNSAVTLPDTDNSDDAPSHWRPQLPKTPSVLLTQVRTDRPQFVVPAKPSPGLPNRHSALGVRFLPSSSP